MIITFLAAMSARKTMDANLSKSRDAACESDCSTIMLEVLADGSFRLNTQPVTAQALVATLHAVAPARA